MKSEVRREASHEILITEGKRWIVFTFKNGEMTGTKQSMSFYKTRKDWIFYGRAITRMLKETKRFYIEQLDIEFDVKNIEIKGLPKGVKIIKTGKMVIGKKDTNSDDIPF